MKQAKLISLLIFLFLCSLMKVADAAGDAGWKSKSLITLPSAATALSYSTDGALIAVGHGDGSVSIWEVKTGKLIKTLKAHQAEVNTIQFARQGTLLLTIGDDKRACLWSTNDWSEKGSIDGVASSGAISTDGRFLAGQDAKQTIWLWDLSTLKQVKSLTDPGIGGTQSMSFTADGKYLATTYNRPLIIDVETKQKLDLVAKNDKKTPIKIEQTGKDQFSLSMGKLQDDDAITHRVMASGSGTLVALGRGWYGQPAFIDVWDIASMKRIGRYKPKGSGMLASFSFDNTLLAIEGEDNATIWNIAQNKQVATVKGNGLIQFSPASMELAITNGNNLTFYIPKP